MKNYLTPAQVAEHLAVSDQTVLNLIGRGELPAIRLSPRVIRVDPEDVEIHLLSRRTQPLDAIRPNTKLGVGRPLTADEWRLIEKAVGRLVRTQPEIDTVFVSGSYAAEDPDGGSDLDFVVVSNERLDFEQRAPILALVSRLARRPDVAFMDVQQFDLARPRFSALRPVYGENHAVESAGTAFQGG